MLEIIIIGAVGTIARLVAKKVEDNRYDRELKRRYTRRPAALQDGPAPWLEKGGEGYVSDRCWTNLS